MSKKFLLATLGTSPAVVTEAIDLLAEQEIQIDSVVLFYTNDPEVVESFELLSQHLPSHCQISNVIGIRIGTYGDIDSTQAAVEFMEIACSQLKFYRDAKYRLFVSIAGGRKVMSTLLALAVQFYGAERLFHIWAPPWIEKEGEISELRQLLEDERIRRLHPPLNVPESDRPRLIDLPFISLFPLLNDILDILKGKSPPAKALRPMLESAGLIDPDGKPTPLGQRVHGILEKIEALPPARHEEPEIHISSHHHADRVKEFARRLLDYAPYVTRIHGEPWSKGEPGVQTEPPNKLIVRVRLRTDILFRLCLVTTAQSAGQLEAARQHIERYVMRQER
ncbi:CRISPR-associated protein Csx14 [Thermoflexus sp.]|uniref:CRISPR-associated protein Csx14 n=1 Tax=Thermoflexus sp. TaxID=1969742 RepID=UPI002ADDCD4C|nr:CRISPR-associated protein Csx14 [Thermoflexus sp.]